MTGNKRPSIPKRASPLLVQNILNTMAAKKDQHTIPQLHLRNFVGHEPEGHVWTFQKETGKTTSASPQEIAFEKHFYSVRRNDGTFDTTIEDYLAEVESKAANVYRMLLNDQLPSNDQERVDFATFLALMKFRTTSMRRTYGDLYGKTLQLQLYANALHDETFENKVRRYTKGTGITLTADEIADLRKGMMNPSDFCFEIHKEHTLVALRGADKLAPILFKMKWSIIHPEHGFFITNDNPLLQDVDPTTRHSIYGGFGFLNKTSQVIFPLSPKRLLYMTWNNRSLNVGHIPRERVERINEAFAARAERFIYSHIRHKNLIKLAAKYKGHKATMELSGFGPVEYGATKVVRNWK